MSLQKRKVLFIIDTIQGSGAERSLVEIAKYFLKYAAVFVHIYKGEMLKPELESHGIKVYSLNVDKKYGFNEAVRKLIPIYEKEKPDIIHATLYRADMVARRLKNKFPDITLIGSFVNNSYTPQRYKNQSMIMKIKLWIAYQLDRNSAKKVDLFISNSETIKQSEGNALGISHDKIKVIYRGRDPRKFQNLNKEKIEELRRSLGLVDKKVILNVSRLIERKGQLDIIQVMPEIIKKNPQSVLIIAGHGGYRKRLESEIKNLGLKSKVILLGRFTEIPELLDIADIFVYPSYAEGLPGALIEAMFSGKIIINSNIGENLECVGGEGSMSYPVGDKTKLEENISKTLANLDLFEGYGIRARQVANQKFSIVNIASDYESTYDQILK